MSLFANLARRTADEDPAAAARLTPKDRGMGSAFGARTLSGTVARMDEEPTVQKAEPDEPTEAMALRAPGQPRVRREDDLDDAQAERQPTVRTKAPVRREDDVAEDDTARAVRARTPPAIPTAAFRQAEEPTEEAAQARRQDDAEDEARPSRQTDAPEDDVQARRENTEEDGAQPRRETMDEGEEPEPAAARVRAQRAAMPAGQSDQAADLTMPELEQQGLPQMGRAARAPDFAPVGAPPMGIDGAQLGEFGAPTIVETPPELPTTAETPAFAGFSERPKVVIDQIDVVIASDRGPANPSAMPTGGARALLASRYLRRI